MIFFQNAIGDVFCFYSGAFDICGEDVGFVFMFDKAYVPADA